MQNELYRVNPVIINENEERFAVEKNFNGIWKIMQRNSSPLIFKLEKMAENEVDRLNKKYPSEFS